MPAETAQKQPKTPHPFLLSATAQLGEKVPHEAIPVHLRKSGIQLVSKTHGNAGENMVSKSEGQGKEDQRSGDRET